MAYDLVIVGMGSGGMPAASFAATVGLEVAVVERGRVGGDCLWTGCVPSKALLSSAKVAQHLRTASRWGLPEVELPPIDTAPVWARIKDVQRRIAETDDDPARYEAEGVEIVHGTARLVGPHAVDVDGRRLEARHVLLCTGSRPAEPDLPGLAEAGYLTSETFFELERCPASLVVIGGGPIAVELAQACHRLGVQVTVLQRADRILPRDEPLLARRLTDLLLEEGLDLRLGVEPRSVEVAPDGRKVVVTDHGRVEADEILVAAGRAPNVEGLGLEALGIEVTRRGIVVDDRGRTAVPTIYAAGDVAGRALFTHAAAYEAVRAVRDLAFPGSGKVEATIPWCTFTDPELAHVGLTSEEARERWGDEAEVHVWELDRNDRARADGAEQGAIVVVCDPKGVVVGGHVLAPGAGELVHELAIAEKRGLKLTWLAGVVHVYPTLSTSIGQLAAEPLFERAGRMRTKVAPVARFLERIPGL